MRYIGCKTKLLEILDDKITKYCGDIKGRIFCDLFSGTCSVGDYFQDKCDIIANDNLYFSYIIARGKLLKNQCSFTKLGFDPFSYFNSVDTDNYISGYCYNTFAPSKSGRQYFSDENAKFIDFIRDKIDYWSENKLIDDIEKDYLIACLLESVSKISNVAGVYSAFLHSWDVRATKRMKYIKVESSKNNYGKNIVYNDDASNVIFQISGNILYLDPPYTPTQYISQYHVLETIAKNDRPEFHGVGAHRENGSQISKWCKKYYVAFELENIIANANFDYIVMSYSDAGILSKNIIEAIFKRYAINGTYVFEQFNFIKYKNTRAINREKRDNTQNVKHYEWLFIMRKNKKNPKFISPLNYIGGKFDVIDFIKSNLPDKIDTFYDLFGGGANVVINVNANKYVYNDLNFFVKQLLEYISTNSFPMIYEYIDKTIKKYNLSKGNKEAYVNFRNFYNSKPFGERNPLDLFLLICYGFEHQIRFNTQLEFNNPCGNSGLNDEILEKLISFSIRAKEINLLFESKSYDCFFDEINVDDFVYCDPPYLLTRGVYNDGKRGFNGWDIKQQRKLFDYLNKLNERNIRFALSYIESRDGTLNEDFVSWIEANKYRKITNTVITKRNRQDRLEILVVNY